MDPIAIVIASKNRPRDCERALRSIARQTVAPSQTVVIDQSAQAYDLQEFPAVTHIHDTTLSGLPAARNRGLREVSAGRVLFLDDDVELQPQTLAALGAAFDAFPDAIGFQCDDLERHDYGRLNALIEWLFGRGFFTPMRRVQRGDVIEVTSLVGYAMAFRAEAFARERFDEGLGGYAYGEDWDFSRRVAHLGRFLVAPGADVHHFHSPVNRLGAGRLCRMRWRNYHRFFRGRYPTPPPRERLWLAWWTVGETYRWMRAGLGLPSDRKAAES